MKRIKTLWGGNEITKREMRSYKKRICKVYKKDTVGT